MNLLHNFLLFGRVHTSFAQLKQERRPPSNPHNKQRNGQTSSGKQFHPIKYTPHQEYTTHINHNRNHSTNNLCRMYLINLHIN